jgi:hypothetical protein
MTVRAEHAKIFQTVVVSNAIYVIQVHRQPASLPLGKAAACALVFQYAGPQESHFYMTTTASAAGEQFFDRHSWQSRFNLATAYRFRPRLHEESEFFRALANRCTGVVLGLNRGPVVLPASIRKWRRRDAHFAA